MKPVPSGASQDDDILLFQLLGRLKMVRRADWVREGIAAPESVADHSFRVAAMVAGLAPAFKGIDRARVRHLEERDVLVA